jgi:hypothetical protein
LRQAYDYWQDQPGNFVERITLIRIKQDMNVKQCTSYIKYTKFRYIYDSKNQFYLTNRNTFPLTNERLRCFQESNGRNFKFHVAE